MSSRKHLHHFEGGNALSDFRARALLERLRASTGSEDEEQAAVLAALFRQPCTDPSGMNTHEPRWTRFDSSPSRAEHMLASCDGEDGC
jgi:hypothetical protein